jgi:ribosome-associated protein
MQKTDFELRGEFITLDRLLKATGVAESGGRARVIITEGHVQVDGQEELRKTAKIRAGQVVSLSGVQIRVLADPADQ